MSSLLLPPDYAHLRNRLARAFHDGTLDSSSYHFLQLLIESAYRHDEESAEAADGMLADMFSAACSGLDPDELKELEEHTLERYRVEAENRTDEDHTSPDISVSCSFHEDDEASLPQAVACSSTPSSNARIKNRRKTARS